MQKWKKDMVLSISIMVACIACFISMALLKTPESKHWIARADSYVQVWVILLFALSCIVLFRALRDKPKDVEVPLWTKNSIFTILVLLGYLILMPKFGFILATSIALFLLLTIFSNAVHTDSESKKTKMFRLGFHIILSIIATVIIYFLFAKVLGVILPSFSLFV